MGGPPRLGPLEAGELTPAQDEVVARVLGGAAPRAANLYLTLVRHPDLFRRWAGLGDTLLFAGRLAARDREILILRTAYNTGSDYEWGQHVRIGLEAGLSAEEIDRCAADSGWIGEDALLVAVADELHATSTLRETTFEALAARYEADAIIELVAVVGYYHLTAYLLNGLAIEPEPGVGGLPGST